MNKKLLIVAFMLFASGLPAFCVALLDILSSMPAGPSVERLVSMPVCAASL